MPDLAINIQSVNSIESVRRVGACWLVNVIAFPRSICIISNSRIDTNTVQISDMHTPSYQDTNDHFR